MKTINYKQLGTPGLSRTGSYIYEEFLPELRWPYAGAIYKEMSSNDPVIGSILYLAEMLIRGTLWDVKPFDTSAEAKVDADFLKSCMDDMESSWADTISEVLSVLIYGFSFHEIMYKIRRGPEEASPKYRSKHTDGKIGWRSLPIRSQTTMHGWIFDNDNELIAFEQQAPPQYKVVEIPLAKGLLFRTRVNNNNPEGKSLLRNAYRPWFFKKHFEEIEGIGIERDLAGFPVLTAPEGLDLWDDSNTAMKGLRNQAEKLVASVRRDSEEGVLLPHGWELSLLTSGSSRQISIGDTIERYDNRIAITMLSDIILIGSNKAGSFALADTKQSMLAASLQAQLNGIADVFNDKAVTQLFACNGAKDLSKLPKIQPSQIQTPSLKELALTMRAMDLNIAGDMEMQNYLRHILGMPSLDKDTFESVYEVQSVKEEVEVIDEDTADIQSGNKGTEQDGKNTTNRFTNKDTIDSDLDKSKKEVK